jgi:hypothetical protein
MKSFQMTVSKAWAIKRTLSLQVIGFELNKQGLKSLDAKDCDSVELVKAIQLGYVKAINYISSLGASWYHIDYKGETL